MAIPSVEPPPSWRENLILRALVVHPLGALAPFVLLGLLGAWVEGDAADSQAGTILLVGLVVAPVASVLATVAAAWRRPLSPSERLGLVFASFAGVVVLFIVCIVVALVVATIACDGAYECPV